ncbi:Hypothetical predicted protein [Octopus vulgaris]|uniref:Uncharacterized protein n=1 Tax=Octopus vulgaris TaxID=6645 RepID=A0AA36F207_OCTVU|nr:Hypothetical predicted protein [Octopus vulgaris]
MIKHENKQNNSFPTNHHCPHCGFSARPYAGLISHTHAYIHIAFGDQRSHQVKYLSSQVALTSESGLNVSATFVFEEHYPVKQRHNYKLYLRGKKVLCGYICICMSLNEVSLE